VVSKAMLQTDARSGELPLIGSLGCWRNTRFRFGLPNARRRRITQSSESDIAEVEGEAELNTTDSGP
jgi:hypothetical protein